MGAERPRGPQPVEIVGEFPCTQSQQRCWFLDQLQPGNPALNVHVRWEIRGTFKTQNIEDAFRKIIERHEILRTGFATVNGAPVQRVVSHVDFHMPVIDIRNAPKPVEERVQAIAKETAVVPFDLAQPGLFRVSFVQVDNERGYILITAHQICFDGWSIRTLGREFGELASALAEERAPGLAPLPLQYGDFALWQAEFLDSYGFEVERRFWLERLDGAPYFEVPPDRPRPTAKTTNGDIVSVAVPEPFGERIAAAARERRISLFSHGAAVVSAMLHRLTGSNCVLIGTQVAGRDDVDLENLIGVFINNVVLRFNLEPQMSFADHFGRTSEIVEAALNNQRMPFNKLVETINPHRDASRNPIISVNFNLQKAFLENAVYGGFELISAASQSPGVIYDLNFIMVGRPDHWRLSIEYNTDLFDRATVEGFLRLWQATYELVLSKTDAGFADIKADRRADPGETRPESRGGSLDDVIREHPAVRDSRSFGEKGSIRSYILVQPHYRGALERLPHAVMEHLNRRGVDPAPATVSVMLELPEADPSLPAAALEANRLDLERKIAAVWRDVLEVEDVGPGDDFFALGGHSLLALRMLSRVEALTGRRPSLAALFEASTLASFVARLDPQPDAGIAKAAGPRIEHWNAATYKHGKGERTLVTLNHPMLFHAVARQIDEETGVVNANLLGSPDLGQLSALSFEEIAAGAVRAIEAEAPSGALSVVGLCINGTLALEVGRQLGARGRDVRLVGMIDSWAPGYFTALPGRTKWIWNAERRVKRLAYFTRKLLARQMSVTAYMSEFRVTQRMFSRMGVIAAPSPEEIDTETMTDLLVHASRAASLEAYAGRTVLFRSLANPRRARDLLFGWRGKLPDSAEVLDLGGWHEDSLSAAAVKDLSAALSSRMA